MFAFTIKGVGGLHRRVYQFSGEFPGKVCGQFCVPPPEPFVSAKTGSDYKPDFLKEGFEETSNPIIAQAEDDDE